MGPSPRGRAAIPAKPSTRPRRTRSPSAGGRLEEWAGRIRAKRQSNQLEEAGDLARKHHRQMDAKRRELSEFYGQRE